MGHAATLLTSDGAPWRVLAKGAGKPVIEHLWREAAANGASEWAGESESAYVVERPSETRYWMQLAAKIVAAGGA